MLILNPASQAPYSGKLHLKPNTRNISSSEPFFDPHITNLLKKDIRNS